MKRVAVGLGFILISASAFARLTVVPPRALPVGDVPSEYRTDSETKTLEWGCPVADVVKARSQSEALQKIKAECIAEVQRAAIEKPEVVDVLETSVIWPDVHVIEGTDGFNLKGTFFLQTLVLQRGER